jgi:hypothetical protein
MMNLTLIPQLGADGDPEMAITVDGDVVTIDGVPYDFASVPDGGEHLPDLTAPFVCPIRRVDGVIHATIIARLGADAAMEQDGPWLVNAASGQVVIPALRQQVPLDDPMLIADGEE